MAPSEVLLARYDLSKGMSAVAGPLLGMPLEGIWHTSIIVYDTEYAFFGNAGIMRFPPYTTQFGQPLRTQVMGTTRKSQDQLEEWNLEQRHNENFGPDSYNILVNNCNHFTHEALCFLLNNVGAPDDEAERAVAVVRREGELYGLVSPRRGVHQHDLLALHGPRRPLFH